METAEVLEVSKQAVFTLLKVVLPLMSAALIMGLIVSLFQALTQIQEMTLSFVPKIILVFTLLMVLLPYMFNTLNDFTQELYLKIAEDTK